MKNKKENGLKVDKKKETIDCFVKVFDVDGKVKMLRLSEHKKFEVVSIIELNDSVRGKFFIAIMNKKKKDEWVTLPKKDIHLLHFK